MLCVNSTVLKTINEWRQVRVSFWQIFPGVPAYRGPKSIWALCPPGHAALPWAPPPPPQAFSLQVRPALVWVPGRTRGCGGAPVTAQQSPASTLGTHACVPDPHPTLAYPHCAHRNMHMLTQADIQEGPHPLQQTPRLFRNPCPWGPRDTW